MVKEVSADLIPSTDAPDRHSRVLSSIDAWSASSGVDKSRFLIQRTPPAQGRASAAVSLHDNLLDAVLRALSERDLSRITIPLDLIDKLRSTKIAFPKR